MQALVISLRKAACDRRAASATEYALMAGILALGLIPAFTGLYSRLQNALSILSF